MFSVKDNKKRPREASDEKQQQQQQHRHRQEQSSSDSCSFCRATPAALTVLVPVRHRKKRVPASYCVACYYTTSVVRLDPEKYVSVYDEDQLEQQLPAIQELFGDVFVEIRKELEEESERAFQQQKADPLAMLHQPKRKLKAPPKGADKKAGKIADGGFLRHVPLPERLLRTQQQQAQLQKAQIDRMNKVASTNHDDEPASNLFQRRKASKKSIWNLAMETQPDSSAKPISSIQKMATEASATCSCGSTDVRSFGNITSRNQDMRKGETWGMKDRGNEVVTKYQCNTCGKSWHEEE